MLSFRSILLVAAAFITMASAIPTAHPSNDAGGIADIVNTRSILASADADAHADIPIRSVNTHVDSDFIIKRGLLAIADADAHADTPIRSVQDNTHVDSDFIIKRGLAAIADANANADLLGRSVDVEDHAHAAE